MNASDAKTFFEAAAADWDTMRLTYCDEKVIETIADAIANMVLHHAQDPAGMLAEMTRVVRPGVWVAITDAIEHPYEWMRTEQADIWLGFTPERVEAFFGSARLARYGYATLGSQ